MRGCAAVSGAAPLGKVVVFGVGLIGGSFALALKAAGQVTEVVGFGRTLGSLTQALELGIVDRAGFNVGQEVSNADLVLIATPVGTTPELMARIAPCLGSQTVVTDAGSTKEDVVKAARACFGERIGQFVPAHPIAGAENSGALAARPDLYQGKAGGADALARKQRNDHRPRTRGLGSLRRRDLRAGSGEHDRIFAAVSHLPHLLSFALVHDLARRDNRELLFAYAASGFRDFTRIAASHPEMWRDICLANRQALLEELDRYREQLDELRDALQRGDGASLEATFDIARTARREWAESKTRT
jgi:prephenate dehydrogenase